MSCTSPLTVASTIRPLPVSPSTRSIIGSRYATAVFIVSADCNTKGSCISPEAKSSPTTFIPASRMSLMMSEGCVAVGQRHLEVGDQAVAVAVDDALAETLLDRPVAAVLGDGLGHRHVGEDREQLVERVVRRRRRPTARPRCPGGPR